MLYSFLNAIIIISIMQFELQQKKRLQTRIHIVRILTEIGKDLLEIGKYVFVFLLKIFVD